MRHARRARVLVGSAAALLAIAALSAPSSAAAPKTRWVDDDGHAGASGCGASASAFKKVQKAVDASAAHDIIVVCPGTYVGVVSVTGPRTGLTIKGAKPHTAILKPPTDSTDPVVTASKNEVAIESLDIVARTSPPCSQTGAGILLTGARDVSITGVDILASTSGDTLGACGLDIGIEVIGGGSATVSHALIRDFKSYGIWVSDTNGAATVLDSTVEYLHQGAAGLATSVSTVPPRSSGQLPASPPSKIGILAINATGLTVRRTTIRSAPGAVDFSTQMYAGIYATAASLHASGNTIRRTWDGFQVWTNDSAAVSIADNDLRAGGGRGILFVGVIGATVHGNRITGFGNEGLAVQLPNSHDNVLSGNDARGNAGTDCSDGTTGAKTAGTADTWTNDKGLDDNPDGLCSPT